jgi:hypothetical protein
MDKIVELYKTSPIFQDLLETSLYTGLAAGGQAVMTDMTPEEIALSSAAGFGAGMVGRPLVGRAGQALGGVIDRRAPQVGKELMGGVEAFTSNLPPGLKAAYEAKMNPYRDLGGASQYFNMIGRGYGDNIAQTAIALAAPGIFDGGKEDEV